MIAFFSAQPACVVAMEACASAHHWGRELQKLGHQVRLIAPAYVKPVVKRQKNDAADAEAICEAAQRPTMRFVSVKGEEKQALAVVFRARDMLVGQRTQLINGLRGHMAEYGVIAPQGPTHVERLIAQIENPASSLPQSARTCLQVLVDTLRDLRARIDRLDAEIAVRAKQDDAARRLMTIPGIGPLIATAIQALAPNLETFKSGRDFAAWVGLTPLQKSTGGKSRLGRTSRMGERTLRRLLIIGASGVVRWARRKGTPAGSWLGSMLARKPPMLVWWRWPTRWRGSPGRCSPRAASTKLRSSPLSGGEREVVSGVGGTKDRYGATSVRRDQKNQAHGERFERGPMMWI